MAGTTYYTAASGSGSAGGNASQATGTYVGDGTDGRLITTGLSGTIRSVVVKNRHGGSFAFKDNTMSGAVASEPGGSINPVGVTFSGANFLVDFPSAFGIDVNTVGFPYFWVAFSTP